MIKAANAAVTAAHERLDDKQRFYENKMNECNERQKLYSLIEGSSQRRADTVERLNRAKEKAQVWSDICSVVTGSLGGDIIDDLLAPSTSSQGKWPPPRGSPLKTAGKGLFVAGSFAAAEGKVFSSSSVREIEGEIDAANAAFEQEVQGYKNAHPCSSA